MDVFGVFQIDSKIIILLRLSSSFPSFSLDNMLPWNKTRCQARRARACLRLNDKEGYGVVGVRLSPYVVVSRASWVAASRTWSSDDFVMQIVVKERCVGVCSGRKDDGLVVKVMPYYAEQLPTDGEAKLQRKTITGPENNLVWFDRHTKRTKKGTDKNMPFFFFSFFPKRSISWEF